MTNIIKLMGTMCRQKTVSVYKVIGIQLLTLIITLISLIWKKQFNAVDLPALAISYGIFAMLVLFILLTLRTEHIWTNSFFRLAPISDTKLYVTNIVSTFLSFIYFLIIEIVIIGLCGATDLTDLNMPDIPHLFGFITSSLALVLALIIISWVFISMVHLVGQSISTFLPDTKQGFLTVLLYTGVFILISLILNSIVSTVQKSVENLFSPLLQSNLVVTNTINTIHALFLESGFILFGIILFSLINIYLLNHWIEPK